MEMEMVRSGPAQSSKIKGHLSLTPKQGKAGHKYNLEYVAKDFSKLA